MKILHLYKDYRPVIGGIENHTRLLAKAQVAAGHQVSVLVCARGFQTQQSEEDGVQVFKTGRLATVASMPLSIRLPLALRKFSPDIVHIHSPFPLGEAANWLFPRATGTVITHHSDVVRQRRLLWFYAPMLRRVLVNAHAIIATSPPYLESSRWLNPIRTKCNVIPLGVDLERFQPPAISTTLSTDQTPRLLFVGCLRYYKGVGTLLEALSKIPNAKLDIVGDGPMRSDWETLTQRLGLQDRVHFSGQVDDTKLLEFYKQAHLFILPANARAEAFGTVLLEAMACGLPLLTTEVGTGTSWVNQDGQTGKVIPPMNAKLMAQAITELLQDPERLKRYGRAARERVTNEFSLEKMIRGVETVYQNVLANASGAKPSHQNPSTVSTSSQPQKMDT